ncbi:hypothetical protein J6590_003557 [Homalodisca vitripennis]|nr:hypothetical protein J6590_003557 [Homalodisca vitripennis]
MLILLKIDVLGDEAPVIHQTSWSILKANTKTKPVVEHLNRSGGETSRVERGSNYCCREWRGRGMEEHSPTPSPPVIVCV